MYYDIPRNACYAREAQIEKSTKTRRGKHAASMREMVRLPISEIEVEITPFSKWR
jgi:hypothetical protein